MTSPSRGRHSANAMPEPAVSDATPADQASANVGVTGRDREELGEAFTALGDPYDEGDKKVSDTLDFEPESESEEEEEEDGEEEEEEEEEEEAFNELLKDNSREASIRLFTNVLDSPEYRETQEKKDRTISYLEDDYDFPEDPENWTEEDLQEFWADAPVGATKPGWDPVWADKEDWDVMLHEINEGRNAPIAPFYVPYGKYYPVIPDNHHDISNAKSVIEELDRTEEFLKWVSYIFPNGCSYEGTVWDDLAHGKGVYVAEPGLVRYEGEWFRNAMEGHGVVEVDIPDIQPVPGSKLEAKMRAKGKIISTDFMTPEDKKWLEMDIKDSVRMSGNRAEIPFYENDQWIKLFGKKPEKGRYKYAGQWKQGRMHGCGVYEINERVLFGRFYFGEYLNDSTGCDTDISALHAGIAEVAAAKARMFVNKPDGMVKEYKGPYGDPQHPYFYEEDDVWMAPGFINQFYEVPDYWKTYVEEVDQEREMWLNSFYRAPLRLPMPAELEYWWETDDAPEFVLVNKEPEPNPEDPSKLVYTEDPLIFHTRTGRLINYVDDEIDGIRLFWQPPLKKGEDIDPEKVKFLPLGFDSYYGREKAAPKKTRLTRMLASMITSVENTMKPILDKVEKWADERKKQGEMNLKLINQELELVESEIYLEEELEDLERMLKKKQEEEEKAAVLQELGSSTLQDVDEIESDEGEVEDEEAPSSFGTVSGRDDDKSGNQPRKSPFSSLSLTLGSASVISTVPDKLLGSLHLAKKGKHGSSASEDRLRYEDVKIWSIRYPHRVGRQISLRSGRLGNRQRSSGRNHSRSRLNDLARILARSGTSS